MTKKPTKIIKKERIEEIIDYRQKKQREESVNEQLKKEKEDKKE
jgi:hypothetical protein